MEARLWGTRHTFMSRRVCRRWMHLICRWRRFVPLPRTEVEWEADKRAVCDWIHRHRRLLVPHVARRPEDAVCLRPGIAHAPPTPHRPHLHLELQRRVLGHRQPPPRLHVHLRHHRRACLLLPRRRDPLHAPEDQIHRPGAKCV